MRSVLALALLAAVPAAAQGPLSLPLDCVLGETCFIQQLPDADPGPGAVDGFGGTLTYDGHTGTDLRVADLAALAGAPPVTAPADGTVLRVRGDVPEGTHPEGQDCGNGLVIDHGAGLETQLCHLAPGSIPVRAGERVARGQPVGRIGRTGRTEFPHVHLTVRRGGAVVDPFAEGLWAEPVPVAPGGLLSAGFADGVPDYDAVKAGTAAADALARTAPMVLWAQMFGTRAGDALRLRIEGPDGGEVFARDVALDRTQAQGFRAAGRRAPAGGWPRGDYRGTATLLRDGEGLAARTVTIPVR
ncbi:M23 family metallopeptidase [Jannaschia sp. W003]|uniref:M23 family metallopeptidase n=1 Tax=Jannaschia sp. W003 TaxID=2867012 RepID=UPI0021A49EA5|nr:M23 family metallopeptidase [Jannaschia sp. W003]UWQ22484.1 M23 family metallopeptidase [Jannaschia sp. W003]